MPKTSVLRKGSDAGPVRGESGAGRQEVATEGQDPFLE